VARLVAAGPPADEAARLSADEEADEVARSVAAAQETVRRPLTCNGKKNLKNIHA